MFVGNRNSDVFVNTVRNSGEKQETEHREKGIGRCRSLQMKSNKRAVLVPFVALVFERIIISCFIFTSPSTVLVSTCPVVGGSCLSVKQQRTAHIKIFFASSASRFDFDSFAPILLTLAENTTKYAWLCSAALWAKVESSSHSDHHSIVELARPRLFFRVLLQDFGAFVTSELTIP